MKFRDYLIPKVSVSRLRRFGRNSDGGYVLCIDPNTRYDHLVSFGVGDDISFERDLINGGVCGSAILYDGTVSGTPQELLSGMEFRKEMVDGAKLADYIPKTGPVLLKSDIESEEYNFVRSTIPENVDQIALEVHFLNKNEAKFIDFLWFFSDSGFDVAHIHGNSHNPQFKMDGIDMPEVLEITFIRKDKCDVFPDSYSCPIPDLDYDNCGGTSDLRFTVSRNTMFPQS